MALLFVFLAFVDDENLLWQKQLFANKGQTGSIFLKTYFVAS
jgi:hypothetical protein